MKKEAAAHKILLVEDDAALRYALRVPLIQDGYRVVEAEGVKDGLSLFKDQRPDLVILDVGLGDGSGFDLCREIRAHKTLSATPIIMMTAHASMEDKAAGFGAGADQYLVKPVPPPEVLLWAKALLRRVNFAAEENDTLEAGDLCLDLKAHLVRCGGAVVSRLTRKEFELLYFLVKHRPKVLSREHILDVLWHTVRVDSVVDAHISHLRKKLPPSVADQIQTISGKGFRFMA